MAETAALLALVLVVAALLVERTVAERRHVAERKTLTNALMARHPGEYIALQRTDDRAPRTPRVERTDDAPVIGL